MNTRTSLMTGATVVAVLVGALVAGAAGPTMDTASSEPVTLVASERWAAGVAADEAEARNDALRGHLEELRSQTRSGWTGRQDDVTGYLAELSGGSSPAAEGEDAEQLVRRFIELHAEALFGAPSSQLDLGAPEGPDPVGTLIYRVRQLSDGVPVLDSHLIVGVADAERAPRVTSLRGRVFGDVGSPGTAGLSAAEAAAAAEAGTGGRAQGEPTLALLPRPVTLVWQVPVMVESHSPAEKGHGEPAALQIVHLDAASGRIVATRPGSAHLLPSSGFALAEGVGSPPAAQEGTPVAISGADPFGRRRQGVGTQFADGSVGLVDTTTPFYDPATGRGAVLTFDAAGMTERELQGLPGTLVQAPGGVVQDADALGVHVLTRYIADYLHSVFGRASWDGQGGDLIASVNFESPSWCNAVFAGGLNPPQMMYGRPCTGSNGTQLVRTMVDPDVAAHEIVHGVTSSTANLLYTGQSGALNESFSDYFGNVIGDAYLGRDSSTMMEESCEGYPLGMCQPTSNTDMAMRDLLNGAQMGDYLYILDPGGMLTEVGASQDHAGVHLNSAIWNNALWSIRTRLAQIDGVPGRESNRARYLDGIVYTALTRYLGPSSGFVDARAAVEQAAGDLRADAVVTDVIRETFDLLGICSTCERPAARAPLPVGVSPATDRRPSVSGETIGWVEYSELEDWGQATAMRVGSDVPMRLGGAQDAISVAVVGEQLVAATWPETGPAAIIVSDPATGSTTTLDGSIGDRASLVLGVAGSAEGAAWINFPEGAIKFFDPADRSVQTVQIPDDAIRPDDPVLTLATGGRTVVAGTMGGKVLVWRVGRPLEQLVFDSDVIAAAADGDRIVVLSLSSLDYEGTAMPIPLTKVELIHLDAPAQRRVLSEAAVPLGVALDGEYVVWPQATALLGGAINEAEARAGYAYADTELYLFSATSGVTYRLLDQRGQQGFPSMSGRRLTWQDAVLGGNDIFTALLPEGL